MKKTFVEPSLLKCQLSLNENIAYSWKEYTKGESTTIYHFTQEVNGSSTIDNGCYGIIYNNPAWPTSAFPGPYWEGVMNEWLAHFFALAEVDERTGQYGGQYASFISCFGTNQMPITPTP